MSTPEEMMRLYGGKMPPPFDADLAGMGGRRPGVPGAMAPPPGAMSGVPGQPPAQPPPPMAGNPIENTAQGLASGIGKLPPAGGATPGIAPGMGGAQGNPAENAQMGALLGSYGEQLALDEMIGQRDRIQALRDKNVGPEGQMVGRVYVAANPLEHLAKGIKDYRYSKAEKDLTEGTKGKDTGRRVGGIKAMQRRIGEKVKGFGNLALGLGKDEDETGT